MAAATSSAALPPAAALPARSGEGSEELVPLPLPAWLYPLCWHTEFPVAQRVDTIEGVCVLSARCAAFVPG
jgi:hypothetical protein